MWVVCKNKKTSEMEVMSRSERELDIDFHIMCGKFIKTYVLKEFQTKEEAEKYKKDIEDADNLLRLF